ncbi:MAG TPA: glycerophosphodiester phosphodiesterase family protein [Pirellulaceae bacterium]|nr:glycerophosphodiester phosphodiesterase family protein [Pirellulaceae bacterium]
MSTLAIAHRGARAFAPENTLVAFEKAHALGCDMFELDVHLSKDGVPVVHHDDQLDRCTNVRSRLSRKGESFLSDYTWDELQTLDVGSWFVEQLSIPADQRQPFLESLKPTEIGQFITREELNYFASGDVRIPSLEQVLEFVKRTGTLVNIELKNLPRMYPGLAEVVMQLVISQGLESQVLISSFDHTLLLEIRQQSSVVATAVLTSNRLAKPVEYLRRLDADAYHPGCYGHCDSLGFSSVSGRLDARGIAELREAGYGVNVWTCNDKPQMRQLVAVGVTGLVSDYPNRVCEVLSESSTTAAS